MGTNKNIKSVFLVAILLLPVLIFIFLKAFGSNQFDIPVYYENGVGDTLSNYCQRSSQVPYTVFTRLAPDKVAKVYHFESEETPNLAERLEELERVQSVFTDKEVSLFTFLNSPSITEKAIRKHEKYVALNPSFWTIRAVDNSEWERFKSCELVMNSEDDRVVLVDSEERIRGYYDISEREETDRLILELKILLSKEE